ncbi:MFS transporter, partial [Francisella tularensis subsp. holarctica]|nr:MFS transporter [Francisella tularensis subsp. holarctica]
AYNIGFGVFGGLFTFLCFFLAETVSEYTAIGIICISAIVGLITLYKLKTLRNL